VYNFGYKMSAEPVLSLGDWIKRRRRLLDLTQQGLADRVHCSVNTIKKIETDSRRPSKQLADLLASQLEVPEEQRSLFLDVARGIRSVDSLGHLNQPSEPPQRRIHLDLIPAPASPILGRESELDELTRLLKDACLVTIIGPGGIGKSSIAQVLAIGYQKRGERVSYIPLVGLDSPEHIPFALASALKLDVPSDADFLEQILVFLQSKKILLVLDNFEHLLDGATVLNTIITASPNTKLLITSREQLGLPGEQVFPLQGLRYPSGTSEAGNWDQYPATSVFVLRARLLIPDFKPMNPEDVVKICQLTEGLPLAIEMAASWVASLSLPEIVSELERDMEILTHTSRLRTSSRHATMRSVFDSSWRILSETEREQFSSLCVFRGGFARQSAEALCGVNKETLASLVRRSMLKFDYKSSRYSIHTLLQMYGEDRLKSAGRHGKIQRLHAEYFMELAGGFTAHLHGKAQKKWFDSLEVEQDNIRAALSFLLSNTEESVSAIRLIIDLCWYWRIHSQVREALGWLETALQVKTDSIPLKAALHFHAGHFGWMQGDYDFALSHQQESFRLWKSLGADGIRGQAYSLHSLGMIAILREDRDSVEKNFAECLSLFEQARDSWGVAFTWKWIGVNHMHTGRAVEAVQFLQKAEEYFRACGDDWALGLTLGFYGWIAYDMGNLAKAKEIAEEAREIRASWGHSSSMIDSLELLVEIAIKQGDKLEARNLCHSALDAADEIGNQKHVAYFKSKLDSLNS
jgi:predicted ATPase/DNA-binding XRE family transcriptional regulator